MKNRKVHLSFLGTTKYHSCNYYYKDEKNKVEGVRFVQEASIHLLCADFCETDQIYVFATERAMAKNWEDNGHTKDDKAILSEGLKMRMGALNLACPVTPMLISNGTNEQEIWNIFQTIYDLLMPNDEIVLDITYGFRSFPMLAMVLVNYAKTLKKITVRSICYGGIEVLTLGGKRLGEIPQEERNAPILELSSFSVLQDWSNAAQDFLVHGNSKKIEDLTAPREIAKLLGEDNTSKEIKDNFRKFNRSIKKTTLSIATVRGVTVINGDVFLELIKVIDEIEQVKLITPLQPLLEKIKNKVGKFQSKDVKNIFRAAEWCDTHDLIQQGITFIQVFVLLYMLEQLGHDYNDKHLQGIMSSCLGLDSNREFKPLHRNIKDHNRQKLLAKEFRSSELVKKFQDLYKNINNKTRNDINHGGMREYPKTPIKLKEILTDSIRRIKDIIE